MFLSICLGLLIFKLDIKSFFEKPICRNCNVILISLDTLGANHLPCYGYERNTAQNLCNFAKDNVLFTNAFIPTPSLAAEVLVVADTLARVLVAPQQLPVGVLTALLGVPVFLYLLSRQPQRSGP